MKRLDIPCGEGCVAIVMDNLEFETISNLLKRESSTAQALADYAKRLENEFNLATGLIKEPEKPKADPESADVPF
jgi:hypothetical protein